MIKSQYLSFYNFLLSNKHLIEIEIKKYIQKLIERKKKVKTCGRMINILFENSKKKIDKKN